MSISLFHVSFFFSVAIIDTDILGFCAILITSLVVSWPLLAFGQLVCKAWFLIADSNLVTKPAGYGYNARKRAIPN